MSYVLLDCLHYLVKEMPSQCYHLSGGLRCGNRRDGSVIAKSGVSYARGSQNLDSKIDVAMVRLPYAAENGRLTNIDSIQYCWRCLRAWRDRLLRAMGYVEVADRHRLMEDKDLRICIEHFEPSQFFTVANTGVANLKFGSLPFSRHSVQRELTPVTPGPAERVVASSLAAVETTATGKKRKPSDKNTLAGSPVKVLMRQYYSQQSNLSEAALQKESDAATIANLQLQLQETRNINLALRTELDQQTIDINRFKTEYKLSLEEFTAGLGGTPADLISIGWARLFADEMFGSRVRLLTGFLSTKMLSIFFELILAYTGGVLPVVFKKKRSSLLDVRDERSNSRKNLYFHRNRMFFVLYFLRTGTTSFELAMIQFGFKSESTTEAWYTSWLRLIKIVLARHFPQPTLDVLARSTPVKFKKEFGASIAGIVDCMEQKMQTASEKMCQRATWSDYKQAHTSKYLVQQAPAGFTTFVSPGYGGRISDLQISSVTSDYDYLEDIPIAQEPASEWDVDDDVEAG